MANKPNVILFCADDLGYGDLSCYGAHELSTPNVDALAENGIRFTNTYSTSAVCTPARFSILTGEYPCRNPYTRILPGNARMIIDTHQQTNPVYFYGYDSELDMESELLVKEPYDEMYLRWLEAQIHYHNSEDERYNNAIILFNNAYEGYKKHYTRNHMPLSQGNRFIF